MDNITPSKTYKLHAPGETEHAIYFTIVGRGKNVEAFFINSKEMGAFQWITALMTSYSRRFADGVDPHLIIKDMKETFDPKGPYVAPDGTGRAVNSVVHHLGLILEKHINNSKEKV